MNKSLRQDQAPLFEELLKYIKKPSTPFHTPGHKGGLNWESEWRHFGKLAEIDLTEVTGFNWAGALSQAETLAAELHRADYSIFLVQGASQGIIGGILGAFSPGETVLVSRNCHVSVLNAIILADLNPVFLENEFHPVLGIPIGIKLESFVRELKKHPYAKGVIITNPTYHGVAARLCTYRDLIQDRLLIVDEAHGGHLGWSGYDGFDAQHEADLWVQGAHKIFGALTQTGMLHLRRRRIDPEKVNQSLKLITTTSPSYILLASLDSNRRWLALRGNSLFQQKLPMVQSLKCNFAKLDGITILDERYLNYSFQMVDPWKLTIFLGNLGITGFEAELFLRQRHHIQPEYADIEQLTFFISPWQDEKDLKRLEHALQDLNRVYAIKSGKITRRKFPCTIPPLMVRPREAILQPYELIPLAKSMGRISASVISPYPPGIPLIGPGELIREEEVAYLTGLLKNGGIVHGLNAAREIAAIKV